MEWSIRSLLNPVITRLLIYGVNPIDVEYVLSVVENINHTNAKSLEKTWLNEWEKKASKYQKLAEQAELNKHRITAQKLYFFAAQCYYATFLINFANPIDKKTVYSRYAELYYKSVQHYNSPVERVDILLKEGTSISGYLHLPKSSKSEKVPCVIIYAGLGSCKEEMHMLARPLVDKGISVFVPDMPGSGESLFMRDVKCSSDLLHLAFSKIPDELSNRSDIDIKRLGVFGLCMGGGYAYRAASIDSRYKLCATFFPLRITQVLPQATPQWMRQGEWYNYQTGGKNASDFMDEMRSLEEGFVTCPYLFIHGKHDNWMTLETASSLFDKAQGPKEKIIIEDEPVFSNKQVVTHTMPVGEQLHWLCYVAADWVSGCFMEKEILQPLNERKVHPIWSKIQIFISALSKTQKETMTKP